MLPLWSTSSVRPSAKSLTSSPSPLHNLSGMHCFPTFTDEEAEFRRSLIIIEDHMTSNWATPMLMCLISKLYCLLPGGLLGIQIFKEH